MAEEIGRHRLLRAALFWMLAAGAVLLMGALAWVPRYVEMCDMLRLRQDAVRIRTRRAERLDALRAEAVALRTEPFTVESVMRTELRIRADGEEVVRIAAAHETLRTDATDAAQPGPEPLERFLSPFAQDPFFRGAVFVLCCAMLVCAFATAGVGGMLKPRVARGG